MEKLLVTKSPSFEDGLFAALATLELAGSVEVCLSAKNYTQQLISKWNRLKAGEGGPRYRVRILDGNEDGVLVAKVFVVRVK